MTLSATNIIPREHVQKSDYASDCAHSVRAHLSKQRPARGSKLISETLVLLSVMTAIIMNVSETPTATRFGTGFLGLFSSLVVYLCHDVVLGLALIVTSAILLPGILTSRTKNADGTLGRHIVRSLAIGLFSVAAFGLGLIMRLTYVHAGLLALAVAGLTKVNEDKRSSGTASGLIIVSQAALVAASLRDIPTWLILVCETCRLTYLCFGH